jgi:two-component system, response regulator YesN
LIYSDNKIPHETLERMETLEEIEEWLTLLFNRLIDILSSDYLEVKSIYIKKAVRYMKDHYKQDIHLSSVAGSININGDYLSKMFKDEMGIGFAEYLCSLRIERAKTLILEGEKDMKNIAGLCGFNNYAYFFNVFKKRTGFTPKEYLNKHFI